MAEYRDEKARWERRIERALQPDAFIPYGAAFAFVRVLGFMGGFEEVVAGGGPSTRPSFLERAKARWGEGDR